MSKAYKNYFPLPNVIFSLGLSPGEIAVYSYLLYCEDRKNLHYREDNCSAHNEYIEKAILFYTGYLDAQNASAYLPRILSDVLEGKLGALGSRIGLKLAVEQSMTANILAADINTDLDNVEKLRSRCVREVKQINGEIKFEDALKYQRGLD